MAQRREQGFTLIEAAVAIAVVAILSGIIVPLVVKNINDAQNARAKNDVQVIAAAVASQYKDFGTRPTQLAGGFADARTEAIWSSGSGTLATGVAAAPGYQTFLQLFAGMDSTTNSTNPSTPAVMNTMWGATTGNEFSWKGPYLSWDVANKSTPWGGRYYIFGYNANGQAAGSPIWVVCPGPDNAIDITYNPVAVAANLPQNWRQVAGSTSLDDIAVRVN
jgi:prepilin-type N-terminal cleavage/methylation domain-containing protein